MNEVAFDNIRAVNELALPIVEKERKVKLSTSYNEKTDTLTVFKLQKAGKKTELKELTAFEKIGKKIIMLNDLLDPIYFAATFTA